MKIHSSDYLLIRFSQRARWLLRRIGDWETRYLGGDLADIRIEKPVFVTGLARSGTTLLLELLASIDGAATHRYRDFPFLMSPYLWNRYLDRVPAREEAVERAHRDRIFITRESPEAMEEPLWQAFFPQVHSPTALHRLTAADGNARFERFYRNHLRKILLIREGERYIAKGNYHVPRIEYLAHLFPDARFIVPIRHPMTHVHSLVRQHELFSGYAEADGRVGRYLEAAGHYEFGPQRVPIRLDSREGDRIVEAWSQGDEYLGYAIQWKELYGFAESVRKSDPDIARRVLVVRYEDLCARPEVVLGEILEHIEVDGSKAGGVWEGVKRVSESGHVPELGEAAEGVLRGEVGEVALAYGYELGSRC